MTQTTAAPVGIEFTETMRGFFSVKVKDDYERGFQQGKQDNSLFEFTLTVTTDNVDEMIADSEHKATMAGTVTAPALSDKPLAVTNGRFNLLVKDPERVQARKMIYRMPMTTTEGKVYFMEGFKSIHDDWGLDMWPDTTTLYVTVHEGGDTSSSMVGRGIVHIKINDFKKQLASMKAVNAPNKFEELKALAKFGQFFNGVLNEVYGGIFARASIFNPDAPPRERRALRLSDPVIHIPVTRDGVRLKLTRYQGGTKGPVILSPGFGTSGLAYTIDTTTTNFPEFLFERGYDVWVFDYRASPELPSSKTQFTLDDVAQNDYPAAVDKVREVTGADSVQVMAHCVGSLTFMMAQALGLQGVRSAICSQLTLHPVSPPLNEIKSGLYLANFLTVLGVDTMTTDFDTESNWSDKLLDTVLRLYPRKDRCNSPVCRRIGFMYGDVFKHEQLNDATHDAIHEMFGVANLGTFKHIATIVRNGHAVTADGQDVYLPNASRLKLPIAFLHGAENRLFLPPGSEKTFQFLCEKNGPEHYVRHVFPNYEHMDCFIGKNAARDVYPTVVAELDKHNRS